MASDEQPILPTHVEPPPEPDLEGVVLADRYKVGKCIGEGGMGAVYLGRHVLLGKRVALKILKQRWCYEKNIVERFLREATSTSIIEHENVIEIQDYGQTPSGSAFFVMELLEGEELGALMDRGPISWPRTRAILVQCCRGLAAAHDKGIIHRDMKPGNVFLVNRHGRDDFVKILDFGIAKVESAAALTRAGMVFGTAGYMAPEQATARSLDGRADLYSLACVAFEMLTGRPPFTGTHPLKTLNRHLREPAPSMRMIAPKLGIPDAVDEVILRALAKHPDDRFADIRAFSAALEAIPDDAPSSTSNSAPSAALSGSFDSAALSGSFDTDPLLEPSSARAADIDVDKTTQLNAIEPTTAPTTAALPTPHARGTAPQSTIPVTATPLAPALAPLAYVYVALAALTTKRLSTGELMDLAERLRRGWAPDAPLTQIAALINDSRAIHDGLPDIVARVAHADQCHATLAGQLTRTRRAEIISDLYQIAGTVTQSIKVRERELAFILRATRQLGLTPDRRLIEIACLFLTLGHSEDGTIDEARRAVLRDQAIEWAPDVPDIERGVAVRWALAEFHRRSTAEARLERAQVAMDRLAATTDTQTLQRIVHDLWQIAGAKGDISARETWFIRDVLERFRLA